MMYKELIQRLRETSMDFGEADHVSVMLLEAADAIKELLNAANFHKYNSEFWEGKYNTLVDEKWIPVTERLPEKEQCCLVVLNNRTVDFCFYTKRFGFGMYLAKKWESANDEVTHWMPLPEPPKEE